MFATGVDEYVKFKAEIEAGFPVDLNGVAHIDCDHCKYFMPKYGKCIITNEKIVNPEGFVGFYCPFRKQYEEVD